MKFPWSKPVPAAEPPHVYCDRCGVAVLANHAQKVKTGWFPRRYCEAHRVPYDEVVSNDYARLMGAPQEVDRYYRRLEVSKDGTPIGYEPIKKGNR